jgi:LacI family transcriptional regulator
MVANETPTAPTGDRRLRRGPSITEIAHAAGLGTATVDRVVNGRSNVREATRAKVLEALERLKGHENVHVGQAVHRITFLSDSGTSFNSTLDAAITAQSERHPNAICSFIGIPTSRVDPIKFANLIERTAEDCDGLIIVAREDLIINRAIRSVMARKVPVLSLTTDLPSSGRIAYVGCDQASAGATAAYLMGQTLGARGGKILLVYSAPYRSQEERELGFRRVLRSEFNQLEIDDRVNSSDDSEQSYRNVMNYIESHGTPAGIYNTVGGNLGVGRALKEHDLVGKVIFIGHELNPNSRQLMESGIMNFAIGHDMLLEVETALSHMCGILEKRQMQPPAFTRVRVYTKYSCN